MKILVGRIDLSALNGKTWHYMGEYMTAFTSEITEDEYCNAHADSLHIEEEVNDPANLFEVVNRYVSSKVESLDFFDDFISIHSCLKCATEEIDGLRSLLTAGQGKCPSCGEELQSSTKTRVALDDPILSKPFANLIWPHNELVLLRGKENIAVAIKRGN